MKVNWAYATGQREDTSSKFLWARIDCQGLSFCSLSEAWYWMVLVSWNAGHFNIFVGDLSPEVTDAALFDSFSAFNSCS